MKIEGFHELSEVPLNSDLTSFVIQHYAEAVVYQADGFVQRNMDYLSHDMIRFLAGQKHPGLIARLFKDRVPVNETGRQVKTKKLNTISQTFRRQMHNLLSTLDRVECYFIKCIKPNSLQKPYSVELANIHRQLVTGGVCQMLQLMREGYPCRVNYLKLHNKFVQYLHEMTVNLTPAEFVEMVLQYLDVDEDEYRIGVSRVFFKFGVYHKIENCLAGVTSSPRARADFCAQLVKQRHLFLFYRAICAAAAVIRIRHAVQERRRRILWKSLALHVKNFYYQVWLPRREHRAVVTLQRWFRQTLIWRIFHLRKIRAIYTLQLWWKDVLMVRYLKSVDRYFERKRAARVVAAVCTAYALKLCRGNELVRTAATVIQRHCRGMLVRNAIRTLANLRRNAAAFAIQRLLRTYLRKTPEERREFRLKVCSGAATPISRRSRTPSRRPGSSDSPDFGTCRSRRAGRPGANQNFERTVEYWELESDLTILPEEKNRLRRSVFVGTTNAPSISRGALSKVLASAQPHISTVENSRPITPLRQQRRTLKSEGVVHHTAQEFERRFRSASKPTSRAPSVTRSATVSRSRPPSADVSVTYSKPPSVRTDAMGDVDELPRPPPSQPQTFARPSVTSAIDTIYSHFSGIRESLGHSRAAAPTADTTMSDDGEPDCDGFETAREQHNVPLAPLGSGFVQSSPQKCSSLRQSSLKLRSSAAQQRSESLKEASVLPTSQLRSPHSKGISALDSRSSDRSPASKQQFCHITRRPSFAPAAADKSPGNAGRFSFAAGGAGGSPWLSNPNTQTELEPSEGSDIGAQLCESKSTDGRRVSQDEMEEEPLSMGIATEAIERELNSRIGDCSSGSLPEDPDSQTTGLRMPRITTKPPRPTRSLVAEGGLTKGNRFRKGSNTPSRSPCATATQDPSLVGLSRSVLSHTTSSFVKSKVYHEGTSLYLNKQRKPLAVIRDVGDPDDEDDDLNDSLLRTQPRALEEREMYKENRLKYSPVHLETRQPDGRCVSQDAASQGTLSQGVNSHTVNETESSSVKSAAFEPSSAVPDEGIIRARASIRAWRSSDETPLLRRLEPPEVDGPVLTSHEPNTPLFGETANQRAGASVGLSGAFKGKVSLSAALSDIENRHKPIIDPNLPPAERLKIILQAEPVAKFCDTPSGHKSCKLFSWERLYDSPAVVKCYVDRYGFTRLLTG